MLQSQYNVILGIGDVTRSAREQCVKFAALNINFFALISSILLVKIVQNCG